MNLGIRRNLRKWLLRGSNVYCPCCHRNFATFLPFGKPVRLNAACPYCGALERHRLIWLFLFGANSYLLKNAKHGEIKLLHIAPERMFFKQFKRQKEIHYFPADKFMHGYRYPKGTKNIDIQTIFYPDNYFDAILCNHVLEHVPYDRQAINEFYRVLRTGGWAILQVPVDYSKEATYEDSAITNAEEREKHFGQYNHLRLYGRDYPVRLAQAGFKVEGIDFCTTFSEQEKKQYGLDEKDGIIYLCKKENAMA
jgi:SAM-dependent methyltransferase